MSSRPREFALPSRTCEVRTLRIWYWETAREFRSLILIGWASFEAVVSYSTNIHLLFTFVCCSATTLLQPQPFLRNYIVWRKNNVFINIITYYLLCFILWNLATYVTLEHKTSLKLLGYICTDSQKYIVWVKIIDFSFMPKIIRTLSKRSCSMIFCKFPTVNILKLWLVICY